MKLECTNLARFKQALQSVKTDLKKPEAEIVNKALKDVAFRAMSFTPFAEPGLVQAQLYRDNILLKIAAKKVAARAGKAKVDRFGNTKLTAKGKAIHHANTSTREIAKEADRILARRVSSTRALRAGWIPAVKAFGGSIRGAAKPKAGGSGQRGGAQKATISKLMGVIRNALVTRPQKGGKVPVENIELAIRALNQAIEFVASDREDYLRRKMIEKALKKNSHK